MKWVGVKKFCQTISLPSFLPLIKFCIYLILFLDSFIQYFLFYLVLSFIYVSDDVWRCVSLTSVSCIMRNSDWYSSSWLCRLSRLYAVPPVSCGTFCAWFCLFVQVAGFWPFDFFSDAIFRAQSSITHFESKISDYWKTKCVKQSHTDANNYPLLDIKGSTEGRCCTSDVSTIKRQFNEARTHIRL